jgi:hypothetical protein
MESYLSLDEFGWPRVCGVDLEPCECFWIDHGCIVLCSDLDGSRNFNIDLAYLYFIRGLLSIWLGENPDDTVRLPLRSTGSDSEQTHPDRCLAAVSKMLGRRLCVAL